MESAAVLRSFNSAVGTTHLKSLLQRPGVTAMNSTTFCKVSKLPVCGGMVFSSTRRHEALLVSCVKTSEASITAKSKDGQQNGVLQKKSPSSTTFPTGFEALLSEVCDETKIAELKVKVGAFEIHMKRNIEVPTIPALVSQPTISSVPSKPASESTSAAPPPPPKSSAEKVSPFTNINVEKAAKLAALEATGPAGYVVVSSPKVGLFRRAKTVKGKKLPPACKEGDVIKEDQVIGYMDQFGADTPITSDVAGEILKILINDGESVGYGDPLIAVLPSFPGIK